MKLIKKIALGTVLAGSIALAGQANAVKLLDKSTKAPVEVKSITITESKIPELVGIVIEGPNVEKFLGLATKFKASTGKNPYELVEKNAKFQIIDKDGKELTLDSISENGDVLLEAKS